MSNSESEYEYANLSESGSEESDNCSSESEDSSEEDIAVDWKDISNVQPNPSPQRFPFVAAPGSTFLLEDNFDILAYFKLFFDDSVLDILVLETNRYSEQQPSRSDSQWKHVDKNEMMIFLAINILQGLIKKPEERMYWSTNEIWCTPVFPKLMNLRRYQSIKRNLHFCNNETFDRNTHPNPKLYKIWPIYEIINNKCSSLHIPERDITIDESLMLYKGRLGWVEKATTNKMDKDGNVISKPKVVIDYNETMGDVYRLDQQLHDYPITIKRGKKYYKKIFFHLLDISIWNAYVLYKKNGGEKKNLEFRSKLVERLIQNYHSDTNIKKLGRPKSSGILRLTERHFPSFVPPTPKKEAPTRYCAVCCAKRDSKGKRKRKESRYMCNTCNVGLCAAPCFEIYHTKENFE